MSNSMLLELPIYPATTSFEVNLDIGTTHFACDLSVCKGACCTMPGPIGAPILESEIPSLEAALPFASKYLSSHALRVIESKGVWQRDRDGTISIPTIADRDCVFVTYEGDIALCSIEKAFRAGEILDFPKPISCHLFPIRIYPKKEKDTYYICYEEIEECEGGRVRGQAEEIPLVEFLQTPIARALGEARLEQLKKLIS